MYTKSEFYMVAILILLWVVAICSKDVKVFADLYTYFIAGWFAGGVLGDAKKIFNKK